MRAKFIPYIAVSVLCFACAGWIAYDFFAPRPGGEGGVAVDAALEYDISDLAKSALEAEIAAPSAEFPSGAVSPFRGFGAAPSAGGGQRAAAPTPRRTFALKGFLKNPPLAILEDAQGAAHIKGQGDFIQNTQIITIKNSSVVLKDSGGTYELTVEENR